MLFVIMGEIIIYMFYFFLSPFILYLKYEFWPKQKHADAHCANTLLLRMYKLI